MPVSSKEFLDIQATLECGFTLKRVRDIIRAYSVTKLVTILTKCFFFHIWTLRATLREIPKDLPLEYLVIIETKLDGSFPNAKFTLNEYEVRARRDRHNNLGGIIEFVRQGVWLKKYEPNCSECICSEFTISKKKWICFSIYRPPSTGNIKTFFEEMNEVISEALCKYQNMIVMGDFIDVKSSNSYKAVCNF